MAVKRLFQTRQTFFDSSGNLAAGYRLFFYVAGQTAKQSTYNSSTGLNANTNPIVLNARGESDTEIWGTVGSTYKVALAAPGSDDPPGVYIWTEDNVSTVNDISDQASLDQWSPTNFVPTYISATSFTVPADKTADFSPGRRMKSANNGGTIFSTILNSAFTSVTTVNVANDSGVLDAGLTSISLGIITPTNSSMPWTMDNRLTIVDNADTTKRLTFELTNIATGNTRTITMPDASFTATGTSTVDALTNKTYVNIANASNPMVELHKPSAIAGSWYLNSSNQMALAQTNGSGAITGDRMTVDLATSVVGGSVLATASEMETATASKMVTAGLMHRHPGMPKAWALVTFNTGTPSLASNYGISGITDNGVGDVTLTFTTAFSGTTYGVLITPQENSVFLYYPSAKNTGNCRILLFSMTGGGSSFPAIDASFFVSFFGDQ